MSLHAQWIEIGSCGFSAATNAKPSMASKKKFSRRTWESTSSLLFVVEEQPTQKDASFEVPYQLRNFYCQKRNLVLDSPTPQLAPHIVITSPEQSWEDYYIPNYNRVDPQWLAFLCVPPIDVSPEMIKTLPHQPTVIPDPLTINTPVFSLSAFTQSLDDASLDRILMPHLATAVQRHLVRAAGIMASVYAVTFRTRYDNPGLVSSMDKPFKWTDPAEPLIASSRYHLGTLVLDSLFPCTVPHIIINQPPPENPWIPVMNRTSDQDAGFGRNLTVPASLVHHRNLPVEEDDEDEEVFVYYSDSPPDSPFVETPPEEEGPFFQDEKDDVLMELVTIPKRDRSCARFAIDIVYNHENEEYSPSTSCEIFDEDYYDDEYDGEEDLPDLDDEWYKTIILRTNMHVEAN